MRKLLIGLMSIAVLSPLFAADIAAVYGNRQDRIISELQASMNNLAEGGTLTNGLTVTGTITQTGNQSVSGTLSVPNRATVGNLTVNTNATISGTLTVTGKVEAAALNLTSCTNGSLPIARIATALTTPGPIGGTTPSTARFTTATFSGTPSFTNALAAPANVTVTITNAPTSTYSAAADWVKIIVDKGGGTLSTNVIATWPIP